MHKLQFIILWFLVKHHCSNLFCSFQFCALASILLLFFAPHVMLIQKKITGNSKNRSSNEGYNFFLVNNDPFTHINPFIPTADSFLFVFVFLIFLNPLSLSIPICDGNKIFIMVTAYSYLCFLYWVKCLQLSLVLLNSWRVSKKSRNFAFLKWCEIYVSRI